MCLFRLGLLSNIVCNRIECEESGLCWEGPDTPPEPVCHLGEVPPKAWPSASWQIVLDAAKGRPATICPAKKKLNLVSEVLTVLLLLLMTNH